MKFGPVASAEAKGGIWVHSIRTGGLILKKGTVIGDAEIAAITAAGVAAITVARIEPGDVPEDTAAAELAAAIAGTGVSVDRAFTGRANLFAETAGVLVVDGPGVDRFNQVNADITLATLGAYTCAFQGW
jgi:molybdenum cofactor cytidylyltransferase